MKRAILITILLIVWNLLHSQSTFTLTGKVISKDDQIPLPFAYVQLKGQALGTVTKPDGTFVIHIPKMHRNGTLTFSYLGYQTQEIGIHEIKINKPLTVILKESSTLLQTVTIESKKGLTAKQVLKKVLNNINLNYPQDSFNVQAYYRERLKENGVHIKYADASCSFFLAPYAAKRYPNNRIAIFSPQKGGISTMNSLTMYWGDRLHRGHFNGRTIHEEQVKIIDSRASSNLSQRNMEANIEGGPLNLIGRDRMKYLRYFMDKRKQKKYIFTLQEQQNKAGKWEYVLSFRPKIKPETIDKLAKLNKFKEASKIWRLFYKEIDKPLAGKLFIDPTSFAVTRASYRVPKELKAYFCGYKVMAIQHFDYAIEIEYKQIGAKWFPNWIRQADEFIITDTTTNTVTPYAAISELMILRVNTANVSAFPTQETFPNYDSNTLYDFPLAYHPEYWEKFHKQYPTTIIPKAILEEMGKHEALETQFRRKQERDSTLLAPIATKKPRSHIVHGITLTDDYAWLKDPKNARNNQPVMNYLKAENAYTANYFIPLREHQRSIFQEMAKHIPKAYESLPTYQRGYTYYFKYKEGKAYRVFYRKKDTPNAPEEVLLDENELAKKHVYFSIDRYSISPDNQVMAYWENVMGNDSPTLVFKNLKTGKLLADTLQRTSDLAWIKDGSGFYYSWQEPRTNRSAKIFKHLFGTPQSEDKLIYEEKDSLFYTWIEDTDDFKYILLGTGSFTTTELRYKLNDGKDDHFQLMHPKKDGHRYYASYYKDRFYIASNQNAQNFKIMETAAANPSLENWRELIPQNKKAALIDFKRFDDFMVLNERSNGTDRIKIIDLYTQKSHYIKMKEGNAVINLGANPKTNTKKVRITYSALNTPTEVYDYNMETREKVLLQKDSIHASPFNNLLNHVKMKKLWATAEDGTKIPITLIYRDFLTNRKKNKHVWLTAYGAYGIGNTPNFNRSIIPLINRGIVYAVAHVRGGNDMGEYWHAQGKMMNKKNTFTDFIACAEHLIQTGYTEKGKIIAQGGSAGGLLMGVIANMHPELFQTVILDVPFVDALNTMLDPKLPATAGEYVEFANPHVKEQFEYMRSYAPYNNVKRQAYPNMLFFTGLNDSRVGYWEPAKMVAKLRQMNTSDKIILLKTNFSTGHGGGSGRYAHYQEMAYKYALVFDLMKLHEKQAQAAQVQK
ncbi:MAG: prolyl oligopeptidase family serine peptidase [Flammeovirgaceae bacterium]